MGRLRCNPQACPGTPHTLLLAQWQVATKTCYLQGTTHNRPSYAESTQEQQAAQAPLQQGSLLRTTACGGGIIHAEEPALLLKVPLPHTSSATQHGMP